MRSRIRPKVKRPSVRQVQSWFFYEPTGLLRWRIDVRNGRGDGYVKYQAGDEVIAKRYVTFNEKYLAVADVIYALMVGKWPIRHLDHKDGNPKNRAWSNLRLANAQQNAMNRKIPSNNSSGCMGVCKRNPRSSTSKWRAVIRYKGKRIYLGNFNEKLDAIVARKAAEEKYFGDWSRSKLPGVT